MSELSVDTLSGSSGVVVTIKTGHTLTLVEDLDAGTAKLTNVGEPTASSDAATKNYVDTQLLTLDTLGELTNVTITSVADNEVLAYDSTSSEWINQTASEAGLATSGDLTSHSSDTSNPHSVTLSQLGLNDTDNLTEGSINLFFTDERVDDRFNNLFTAGTGLSGTYDDAGNSYTLNLDSLTVSLFDTAAIVTESEGLNSSDSDSSLPTTAAVKDYVDTEVTNAVTGGSTLSAATLNKDDNTVITEYQVQVADDGSGTQNVFFYDGEKESSLNLQAGETVRFILEDSSNTGHPFALSTTKDGTHNSGSEYTTGKTSNGTIGQAGAYIEYVIDAATADTLYPYCGTHSGMGGDSVFVSGGYVNNDSTSTLTNKTISLTSNTLTGTTSEFNTALSDDSFATLAGTETLTNKTLDAVTLAGAVTGGDQEISAIKFKDYAETDVAVSSSSGVVAIDLANGNTGSLTLTENVTDIDFTNVPTNGVSSFTLKITQDASSAYTVAINAITVNGGGDVTAKTAGGSGFTMSATLSGEDLVTFLFFDGSTPYLNALQDFS